MGGKDVIYVKQHHTSPLSKLEMKNYIQDIGNQRFSDINSQTSSGQTKSKDKASSPQYHFFLHKFILFRLLVAIDILLDYFNYCFLQGVDAFSFNSQGVYPQPTTATYPIGKEVCNIPVLLL